MPGFGIFGKVSVDGSALKRIAADTKVAFAPLGQTIGQQFKGQIMNYIGGAAIAAAIKKTIENATEIRSGANKAETNTDRFQAMKRIADESGESVDSLVEILKEGGPAAEELSASLEKVQAYMKETGQTIDSEQITKLAELGDKIKDLMGKIAPGLTWLLDWAIKLQSLGSRNADASVGLIKKGIGKVGSFFGFLSKDNDWITEGDQQFNEAMATDWRGPATRSESPISKAATDFGAIKDNAERIKNKKKLIEEDQKRREGYSKNPAHLPVGGLSQAGAVFGTATQWDRMSQMEQLRTLQQIAKHTAEF